MEEPPLILRSSLSTALKRRVLFRGTALACLGATILLLSGIFIPAVTLGIWGFLIITFSAALITIGLLPYRKLTFLEVNPNKLVIDHRMVHFLEKEKEQLSIPLSVIKKIEFFQKGELYGIGLKLEHPLSEKLIVYDPHFDLSGFQKKARQGFNFDLFFPYFTKRSYESWIDFQKIEAE